MTIETYRADTRLVIPATICGCWFELRAGVRSKSNYRQGAESDWRSQKQFTSDVAWAAKLARPADWPVCDANLPLPRRPQVMAFMWARTLIDAGNLSKSILDACEEILYVNDAQCRHVGQFVERSARDQRGVCGFVLLEPGPISNGVILDVADALARAVTARAELG